MLRGNSTFSTMLEPNPIIHYLNVFHIIMLILTIIWILFLYFTISIIIDDCVMKHRKNLERIKNKQTYLRPKNKIV